MTYLTSLLNKPMTIFAELEGVDVFHYNKPPETEAPYGVWKEEGDTSINSDNQRSERTLEGILDYYTLDDIDPALDKLEEAMSKMGASWKLVSVQHEDDTNLNHYSWDWSVM